tara:strand:+ start:336 stop:1340 length:1005 start_codon:yes stop_codon:yes gene_type:complete
MTCILLTGGSGYIGSHTASLLAEKNYKFHIIDNFSNSKISVIERLEKITKQKVSYSECDIRNTENIIEIIKNNHITSVIHFAALKSVANSLNNPLDYYDVNVLGTISLLKAMQKTGIKNLLFSSSATVYGKPAYLPIDENHPLKAINPYGETKLIVEKILQDLYISDLEWSITFLRYFNPVGAHPSSLIGDDPTADISKNIMPSILKVVTGFKKNIEIYGGDYDTPDGTGIRDYIHIMDLADAHVKALDYVQQYKGVNVFNLGTGKGYSVIELINAFEKATGRKVDKKIVGRREGDVASCFADPSKANSKLGWETKYNLDDMCKSSWKFSMLNS